MSKKEDSEKNLPDEVKQFIMEHIDSIAQWEALLLLYNNTQMKWTAEEVAHHIYISITEACELLDQLHLKGFIKSEKDLYWYYCDSKELERSFIMTANLYSRCLVPITNLIHSKPKNKIQKFADAFKLSKD